MGGHEVVELGDEGLHLRDELDESLRDEDDAEILAGGGALRDDRAQVVRDLAEGHLLRLDFLGDEADVRLGLEGALEGDVARGTSHELDEVPVFLGAVRVALDVADELGIGLARGVETEGGLDHVVLEVAVDRLRHADHLGFHPEFREMLGQEGGVRVRVVAADDDDGVEFHLLRGGDRGGDLRRGLDLGPSRADDVESAGIAVFVHEFILDFDVLLLDQAGRTAQKAEELRGGVSLLDAVIEAGDDVVSAGGLSARKDDADAEGLSDVLVLSLDEGNEGFSVGILEEGLQLGLVRYGLRGLTHLDRDGIRLCGQDGR